MTHHPRLAYRMIRHLQQLIGGFLFFCLAVFLLSTVFLCVPWVMYVFTVTDPTIPAWGHVLGWFFLGTGFIGLLEGAYEEFFS